MSDPPHSSPWLPPDAGPTERPAPSANAAQHVPPQAWSAPPRRRRLVVPWWSAALAALVLVAALAGCAVLALRDDDDGPGRSPSNATRTPATAAVVRAARDPFDAAGPAGRSSPRRRSAGRPSRRPRRRAPAAAGCWSPSACTT